MHLTDDERLGLAEDANVQHQHLDDCTMCREEVSQLRATLRQLADDDVLPEPSPLYWAHFGRRLSEVLDAEAPSRPWWRPSRLWSSWHVATASVALLLITALMMRPWRAPLETASPEALPAGVVATSAPAADAEWDAVLSMVEGADAQAVDVAEWDGRRAVLHDEDIGLLDDAERSALAGELREALRDANAPIGL